MKQTVKVAAFVEAGEKELSVGANDNQAPEWAGKVRRLMDVVIDKEPWPVSSRNAPDDRAINASELNAITALIDFQADQFGVGPLLISLAVEISFEVNGIGELRAWQFDAVTRFLVHLYDRCAP